jgi:hypothetical protein
MLALHTTIAAIIVHDSQRRVGELKPPINISAVGAALILCSCLGNEPIAHAVRPTHAAVTACVIGGLGYPITSPVGGISEDMRARGITVVEGGPGDWPAISSCDIVVGHSLGVDAALKAAPGKRLIIAIDAFTRSQCPADATVVDIHNTNQSFPTTGPLACAQRTIGIDSGFGLAGHVNAPVAARPLIVQIVDEYLTAPAHAAK